MVNAEFSRIYRFVKLLVNEGFLAVVIIRLPCGQGQLSRIWKVQRDWLSLGKECYLRLSRHLWGGMKNELP